jgi:TolB protein
MSLLSRFNWLAIVACGFASVQVARAELHVDITKATPQPMPIAVTDLVGGNEAAARIGRDISGVISADLERSGLFKPLAQSSFVQTADTIGVSPRFGDWRVIGAQGMVSGLARYESDGSLHVEFRLWDVLGEAQIEGQQYNLTAQTLAAAPDFWRRVAHKAADAIYRRVTGEDGYFDTQIVYVAETGPLTNRIKRLAIMDQDMYGTRILTDPKVLALTPRFAPKTREITYMSYFNNTPRVYLYNLDTGQQEKVGDFPGMTFAPRFSPDGNKVIMSLSTNGKSEIYSLDLRNRVQQRLTSNTNAIDTSPCYSPDGQKIVFNSDRGGAQQLYTMNADGSNVQRISFGPGRYATPVWSPRGDLIAFTKFGLGTGLFYIGVMHPDGSGERIVSESFLDEGPTWAPNGRVLMFFRQTKTDSRGGGGSSRLVSVDLTGLNMRELVTPTDASDPAWSPLIP